MLLVVGFGWFWYGFCRMLKDVPKVVVLVGLFVFLWTLIGWCFHELPGFRNFWWPFVLVFHGTFLGC